MSSLGLTGIPDNAGAEVVRRGGAIGQFEQFFFASGRLAHPVYYAGDQAFADLVAFLDRHLRS